MTALRVAVTGAGGFVGSALCRQLLAEGHVAVAVTRAAAATEGAVHYRIGGLEDVAGIRAAFAGADAVVHLAARVHVMAETAADPVAEFRRVNVEGTRAVLAAAREGGVGRFVYLSSIKVNGDGRDEPYSERDEPRPTDAYGQSKLDAETVVRTTAGSASWTILRPPLVYGPGVGGNFRRLLRLAGIATRWPLPLGGMDNLRSMIFVENLTSAIAATITHQRASCATFLVSDDHDVGVSELLQRLAIGLGGRPRLFRAPMGLLQLAGSALGREADLHRILGTLRVNCTLIKSTLGWRPPIELGDALGITARWWRGMAAG